MRQRPLSELVFVDHLADLFSPYPRAPSLSRTGGTRAEDLLRKRVGGGFAAQPSAAAFPPFSPLLVR